MAHPQEDGKDGDARHRTGSVKALAAAVDAAEREDVSEMSERRRLKEEMLQAAARRRQAAQGEAAQQRQGSVRMRAAAIETAQQAAQQQEVATSHDGWKARKREESIASASMQSPDTPVSPAGAAAAAGAPAAGMEADELGAARAAVDELERELAGGAHLAVSARRTPPGAREPSAAVPVPAPAPPPAPAPAPPVAAAPALAPAAPPARAPAPTPAAGGRPREIQVGQAQHVFAADPQGRPAPLTPPAPRTRKQAAIVAAAKVAAACITLVAARRASRDLRFGLSAVAMVLAAEGILPLAKGLAE
eukprot:TRINITY_DN253_c0_g1_i1.p3 TRINITY_DN253_c0_g1~~TRINITY_DN253_c0_g1_i1.p3  ORF type:complete len:305 (+),score=61.83 TRINITY_DN253_c0_g1_i1:76-990(+)